MASGTLNELNNYLTSWLRRVGQVKCLPATELRRDGLPDDDMVTGILGRMGLIEKLEFGDGSIGYRITDEGREHLAVWEVMGS